MRTSLLSGLAACLSVAMCAGLGYASSRQTDDLHAAMQAEEQAQPMRLGMMGPYDLAQLPAMRSAGVTDVLLEISWPRAEPSQGSFDVGYLSSIKVQADALEAAGFQVALSTGMMNAPDWLLALPGARYVDQSGDVFTDYPVPNLVFGSALRPLAQQYLNKLFSVVGVGFSNVRAGGGIMGELSYPYEFASNGTVLNRYWAFDANAAAQDPVPGWRPGSPSPHGEASTFLSWYLNRLASFQNWQVQSLRSAGYHGAVTMLYPSFGMRSGDFNKAVATNLGGTSSAEINGEVQRGYDFARQITALTDPGVVVYSTWGDNPAPVQYLAGLAAAKHLQFMAENGGGNSGAQIDVALRTAAAAGAVVFYLVRAPQFFCQCSGFATIDQASQSYRSAIGSPPPSASGVVTSVGVPSTLVSGSGPPVGASTVPVVPSGPDGRTPSASPPTSSASAAISTPKSVRLRVTKGATTERGKVWTGSVDASAKGSSRALIRLQVLIRTAHRTVVARTLAVTVPLGAQRIRIVLPSSGPCWITVRYAGNAHLGRAVSKAVRVRA